MSGVFSDSKLLVVRVARKDDLLRYIRPLVLSVLENWPRAAPDEVSAVVDRAMTRF